MKFTEVKTSAPHRVFLVDDGKFVLHDTRGARVSRMSLIDGALEAFNMEGSLGKQLSERKRGEGLAIQGAQLHHYIIASVNSDIAVSSKTSLSPATTRPIAVEFLKEKR